MGSPLPNLPGFLPSIPPCVDPNKPSLGRAQTLVYKNGYAIDRCAATGQHPSIGATTTAASSPATTKRAPPPPAPAAATTTGPPPPPLALPLTGAPPPPTTYQASFCGAAGRSNTGGGTSPPPAGTNNNNTLPRPLAAAAAAAAANANANAAVELPPATGMAARGLSSSSLPPSTTTKTTTTKRKNELAEYAEARLGKPSHLLDGGGALLGRFLSNGGRVLRFSARWDDASAATFGDSRRRFVLALHLEDDTVEVIEVAGASASSSSGALAAATTTAAAPLLNQPGGNVFLRRAPLPKALESPGGAGVAPLHLLSARRALPREQFVTAEDLRVGGTVAVHGRRFVLTGCDEATKAYYREALRLQGELDETAFFSFKGEGGTADGDAAFGAAASTTATDAAAAAAAARPALPPHNGIGAPEDTLMNCLSLVPRRPPKDLVRLMNKDNVALVFEARFAGSAERAERAEEAAAEARRACAAASTGATGGGLFGASSASATFYAKGSLASTAGSSSSSANATNPKALAAAASEAAAAATAARTEASRRFVLTYYYGDNTIAIHEPPVKNSGVPGGRFLERGVVRRPPAAAAPGAVDEPLTHSDLFVGAVVPIHGRMFELINADSFTLDYMEQNGAHLFVAADARGAARSVRAQLVQKTRGDAERAAADLKAALQAEVNDDERVTDAQLHRALEKGLGVACVAHQALALRRAADGQRLGSAKVDDVVAFVMSGGEGPDGSWSTQGGGVV